MNFIDATVDSIAPGSVTVALPQSAEKLVANVDGERLQRGQHVTLGVRPEHLRLDGDEQFVQCATVLSERLGEHSYIHADHATGTLIAKAIGDTPIGSGERIRIHVPPSACHLFDADGIALRRIAFEPERAAA
jgi:multiple sugar transport system ATP-binding protein